MINLLRFYVSILFVFLQELDEFMQTLADLGQPHIERDMIRRLMMENDADDSGEIDDEEFATIMVNAICHCALPKGELIDSSTGRPWTVPSTGLLVIEMKFECDNLPNVSDVGKDEGVDGIVAAIHDAKSDAQKYMLFDRAINSPYFYLNADQAQMLYDEVRDIHKSPLDLIAEVLPQLVNPENCIQFINDNLDGKFLC